jgi:hypothetical protein
MTTVQVAIGDTEYAQTVSALLGREARYQLLMVAEPDLTREGVIVLDCEHLQQLGSAVDAPERFVLITRKDPERLASLWNAGIRHVVFREDSASTLQLAVSAAELRQPRGTAQHAGDRRGMEPARPGAHRHYNRGLTLHVTGACGADGSRTCMHVLFPRYEF